MDKNNFTIHKAYERGHSKMDWLEANFSFSFANWFVPTRMGLGTLRVLNDDIIAANNGFGMHPHQDMEIFTIVLQGELTHEDSMGNSGVIKVGDVQRMSAGTGVSHSEINKHKTVDVNSLQIWIETKKNGIIPSYEQKSFDPKKRKNKLQLQLSPDGRDISLTIHQDAFISRLNLEKEKTLTYNKYIENNVLYMFVIDGNIEINNIELNKRDAIAIKDEDSIKLKSNENADILILEIPIK